MEIGSKVLYLDEMRAEMCRSLVSRSRSFFMGSETVKIIHAVLPNTWSERFALPETRPSELSEVAIEVQLVFEAKVPARSRRSARFSWKELVAILGDEWPNKKNWSQIKKSILDKKAYPMPGFELPPEKSPGAMGQTKKPGSHSESKHNRR